MQHNSRQVAQETMTWQSKVHKQIAEHKTIYCLLFTYVNTQKGFNSYSCITMINSSTFNDPFLFVFIFSRFQLIFPLNLQI